MASDNDWMLVEFEGTYLIAHPDGIKGQKVLRDFHVTVEMEKSFLKAKGLRGAFNTYYKEELRKLYPQMIDLFRFRMVQATELDGSKINNPKAMSHEDLLQYIRDRRYPINTALHDDQDLRHQVVLYEVDEKGQQHLQGHAERVRGGKLEVTRRIRERGSAVKVLAPTAEAKAETVTAQKAIDAKAPPKSTKEHAKATAAKVQAPAKGPTEDLNWIGIAEESEPSA